MFKNIMGAVEMLQASEEVEQQIEKFVNSCLRKQINLLTKEDLIILKQYFIINKDAENIKKYSKRLEYVINAEEKEEYMKNKVEKIKILKLSIKQITKEIEEEFDDDVYNFKMKKINDKQRLLDILER